MDKMLCTPDVAARVIATLDSARDIVFEAGDIELLSAMNSVLFEEHDTVRNTQNMIQNLIKPHERCVPVLEGLLSSGSELSDDERADLRESLCQHRRIIAAGLANIESLERRLTEKNALMHANSKRINELGKGNDMLMARLSAMGADVMRAETDDRGAVIDPNPDNDADLREADDIRNPFDKR